jgi:hypothetical protein
MLLFGDAVMSLLASMASALLMRPERGCLCNLGFCFLTYGVWGLARGTLPREKRSYGHRRPYER